MKATYKCENEKCAHTVTIKLTRQPVLCEKCQNIMHRQWGNVGSEVPEWFGDHYFNTLRSKMETSLPSGKDRNVF